MNFHFHFHDAAMKIRQIASDILTVAESMSPERDGSLHHEDAIRVAAVTVKGVLAALAANNKDPEIGIENYRHAFVDMLDVIL